MGDDDMFSSDLSDDQLKTRLGHMANTPCQVKTKLNITIIDSFPVPVNILFLDEAIGIWLASYILHVRCWTQVIFSMGDEYVPDYVDKKALVNR